MKGRDRQRLLSLHDDTDTAVLSLLAAHRVLTTGQIERLLDRPLRTVEHRMAKLAQAGLVLGERPPRRTGSAPYHWSLSASGIAFVTGSRPRRNPRKLSPFHLAHAAAVSDFVVSLSVVGREAGIRRAEWFREEEGWERWTSGGEDRAVCPDGVAVVEVDTEVGPLEVAVFVEVDMGTMSHPRLRFKLLRYLRYAQERRWQGRWLCCPPVLVATTSEARVATVLDGLARMRSGKLRNLSWTTRGGAGELVVAVCAEVHDPDAAIADPVWRTRPEAAGVRLADLLARAAAAGVDHRRAEQEQERDQRAARRRAELCTLWRDLFTAQGLGAELAAATGDPRHEDALWALVRRAYPGPSTYDLDVHFAEVDESAAEELLRWRGTGGPLSAEVFDALDEAFAERWCAQAERVVDACRRAPDSRSVRRAAATLARGRIFRGGDDERLIEDHDGRRAGVATRQRSSSTASDVRRRWPLTCVASAWWPVSAPTVGRWPTSTTGSTCGAVPGAGRRFPCGPVGRRTVAPGAGDTSSPTTNVPSSPRLPKQSKCFAPPCCGDGHRSAVGERRHDPVGSRQAFHRPRRWRTSHGTAPWPAGEVAELLGRVTRRHSEGGRGNFSADRPSQRGGIIRWAITERKPA